MENTRNGKRIDGVFTSRTYKSDMEFSFGLYLPEGTENAKEAALSIEHDGLNASLAEAMEKLYREGKAPLTVSVGVPAAVLHATLPEETDRNMRMNNYDLFNRDFADFLVFELIPYLKSTYHLPISKNPDWHMVSGGSSGGISAWNVAWTHPEYFHRVYMSSPSFLAMGNGRELPALMRKCETKPIRVYMEYSENEPDDYFGSSFVAAMDAQKALEFAGYDYQCVYFPGEGHCSRYSKDNEETLYRGMEWLWESYAERTVLPKRLSARMDKLISMDEPWKKLAREDFPGKSGEKVNAVLSSDSWRLYSGDRNYPVIYAQSVLPNQKMSEKKTLAYLHTESEYEYSGAFDLVLDEQDRIYAATEMGIQCVRSFGLVDVILPLPQGEIPRRLAFVGNMLYAETEQSCYCRRMKVNGIGNQRPVPPTVKSYYD